MLKPIQMLALTAAAVATGLIVADSRAQQQRQQSQAPLVVVYKSPT
jgi:hypothetical protein